MAAIGQYTEMDLYALARALKGQDWANFPVSGWLKSTISNAQEAGASGMKTLQGALPLMLGAEGVVELFKVDPDSAPPKITPPVEKNDFDVPDLPKACRLTAAQARQADDVGAFERRYTAWAGAMANQTPVSYHQAMAIALISIAIGRRCYVAAPWLQNIFPNQYVIILGTTTYHRKSTGLNIMKMIIEEAMPHLLMPRAGSTENFTNLLAGKWDSSDMPAEQKAVLDRARPFAGQRAVIRDEISGLFRSFGRDHMAGMKEDLMDMYESPNSHTMTTNSRGMAVARNISPSLIGASTPQGMSLAVSREDWQNGNLARFVMVTPEPSYKDRPRPEATIPADEFITVLKGLHEKLPAPPGPEAMGQSQKAEVWSLVAPIWDEVTAYSDALREMTNPNRTDSLDNRLRGTYGRHHVKAVKVALAIAVMDWFESKKTEAKPAISKAHWYRALQIAEDWRASAHRFLQEMTMSEDVEALERTYSHLLRHPEGETKSELLKRTNLSRSALDSALETLAESGKVAVGKRKNARGPEATLYLAI